MRVLVICQAGSVMLVAEGGRVTPIVPGPQDTTGNPYLRFGPIIRELLGVDPLSTTLTVATVTSNSLDAMKG